MVGAIRLLETDDNLSQRESERTSTRYTSHKHYCRASYSTI